MKILPVSSAMTVCFAGVAHAHLSDAPLARHVMHLDWLVFLVLVPAIIGLGYRLKRG